MISLSKKVKKILGGQFPVSAGLNQNEITNYKTNYKCQSAHTIMTAFREQWKLIKNY